MSDTSTLEQLMDTINIIVDNNDIVTPPFTITNRQDPELYFDIYWNGNSRYYSYSHSVYNLYEQQGVFDQTFFHTIANMGTKAQEDMLFTLEECILKRI